MEQALNMAFIDDHRETRAHSVRVNMRYARDGEFARAQRQKCSWEPDEHLAVSFNRSTDQLTRGSRRECEPVP
ncbi:hypothetical protein EI94DRAFT_1713413 [Lactarius quietus]|nr:hypothetical protein EI94DRAFT_1713413 [Lactarius quietus]